MALTSMNACDQEKYISCIIKPNYRLHKTARSLSTVFRYCLTVSNSLHSLHNDILWIPEVGPSSAKYEKLMYYILFMYIFPLTKKKAMSNKEFYMVMAGYNLQDEKKIFL